MRPISKQSGFGLIEVLITVVILAIGLLGLSSLHSRTIQAVREGDNLVTASILAQEMAQRMMSNSYITAQGRAGYLATDINGDVGDAGGVTAWAADVEGDNPDIIRCYPPDETISCAASGDDLNVPADHINALTNMQLMDEVEMRLLTAELLPDGEMMICFDSDDPYNTWECDNTATRIAARDENVYTIKVRWTNIFTDSPQQYTLQFTAECTDPTTDGCGN